MTKHPHDSVKAIFTAPLLPDKDDEVVDLCQSSTDSLVSESAVAVLKSWTLPHESAIIPPSKVPKIILLFISMGQI